MYAWSKKLTNFSIWMGWHPIFWVSSCQPRPLPAEPSTVASPAMSGWLLINVDEAGLVAWMACNQLPGRDMLHGDPHVTGFKSSR